MAETPETLPAVVPPPASEAEGETVQEEEDEFQARVNRLLEMVDEDPRVRDRMLAEVYVTVAEFQAQFRAMQEDVQRMGPRAVLKSMFGGGKD